MFLHHSRFSSKSILQGSLVLLLVAALVGCNDEGSSVKRDQAQKAEEAANSLNFTDNAEIENIKKRLELTSKPGLLGYIVLLNDMGQPVFYSGIKGKPTSGSKRLTRLDEYYPKGSNGFMRHSSSDEGTYGSSGNYIFFWTTEGQYMQWDGRYLYSDQPLRLAIQPLVMQIQGK